MRAPTSPRIEYVPLEVQHLDVFHDLLVDPHVRRYLMDDEAVSREWAAAGITDSVALREARGVGIWLLRVDGDWAGFAGFRVFPDIDPEPQLLYALRDTATGRGLATEAGLACLRFADWPRFVTAVDPPNHASVRVLEKLGFLFAGRLEPDGFPKTHVYRMGGRRRFDVAHTWGGQRLGEDERASVWISTEPGLLNIGVEAPFHDDPPPPVGADLWNHEVVEVFFLGDANRYLEVELGPFGQHRVLALDGVRSVARDHLDIDFEARRVGDRWWGVASLDATLLPPGFRRLNAYAIHGVGAARRYLAWRPVPGERPDFHRLDCFGPLGPAAPD